jgi:hypothetical protein
MVPYETTFQKYDFKFHLFHRLVEVYNRNLKRNNINKSILGNKTFDTTLITKNKPANVQDIKTSVATTSKLILFISLDLSTTALDSKFNVAIGFD